MPRLRAADCQAAECHRLPLTRTATLPIVMPSPGPRGSGMTLAVWAIFGGAITRIAAVQLARREKIGMIDALRFAQKKFAAYFSAHHYQGNLPFLTTPGTLTTREATALRWNLFVPHWPESP